MKTILSLTALAALLGLLPFALAESKAIRSSKTPKVESTALPAGTTSKSTTRESEIVPIAAKTAKTTSKTSKTSAKPASKATPPKASTVKAAKTPQSDKKPAPKSDTKPVAKSPLTPAQEDKLLALLNEGTIDELIDIPGIAATRADSIVSARPYASIHEVILVEGVGNATFEKILSHGKMLAQSSGGSTAGTRKS